MIVEPSNRGKGQRDEHAHQAPAEAEKRDIAPLITVRELALLLCWKLSRTYEATRRQEIPGLVEINGRLLYRRRVVEAWLSGESSASEQ